MNKLISTDERVFMCVCGSSGSGKTQLICDMLAKKSGIFQPSFQKIVYYYRFWQPIYKKFVDQVNGKTFFVKVDERNPTDGDSKLSFQQVTEKIQPSLRVSKHKLNRVENLISNLLNRTTETSGFATAIGIDKILMINAMSFWKAPSLLLWP